ncbi:hypothetical protein V495_01026 [Pseudogymnoascus sp. VKM F-4514 (FW-929)]|nr:hypothetical protein V495_01026 [Pseudogymnoascus sp. VKM F-4514 (FW-929)]
MAGSDIATLLGEQWDFYKRKVWDAERELISAAQKQYEVSTEFEEPEERLKLSLHANALRLEGIRRRITDAVDYELKSAGFFGDDEMVSQILLRDVLSEQRTRVDNLVILQEVAKGGNGARKSQMKSLYSMTALLLVYVDTLCKGSRGIVSQHGNLAEIDRFSFQN